jgi:hypothetical protein
MDQEFEGWVYSAFKRKVICTLTFPRNKDQQLASYHGTFPLSTRSSPKVRTIAFNQNIRKATNSGKNTPSYPRTEPQP